jgi:Caspase domain
MTLRFIGIGVDKYTNATASAPKQSWDLDYAALDCQRLAKELEICELLSECHILADGFELTRPWRGSIWRLIRGLKGGDDPLIFYFAGHGFPIDGELHICPGDYDPDISDKSAVSVSEIIAELFPKAPWLVIILDCCRAPLNGAADGVSFGFGGMLHLADNVLVMFACSHGEYSIEAPVIGDGFGGVFSHFLARSFRNAFSARNMVAVGSIFNDARDETSSFANEEGCRQTPRMLGAQGDDLYFIRKKA